MRTTVTFKIISLSIALIVFLNSSGSAATYYVSPNGSNGNAGTLIQPWKTIQKAASTMVAGDTVLVMQGVYKELVIVGNSGSVNQPIVFMAYSGDMPIIDGSTYAVPNGQALFYVNGKDHIILDGFEIRHSDEYLVKYIYSDFGVVRNCLIYDNDADRNSGAVFIECEYPTIEACEVYDTGWNAINLISCNNGQVRFNFIHDNPLHAGINMFPRTSVDPQATWYGNDVIGNVVEGCTAGIYMRYQMDNVVKNNLVYNCTNGVRIDRHDSFGPSNYTTNTKFYNNTFADNTKTGFQVYYGNGLTLKNNVFAFNANKSLDFNATSGHTIDNNLYAPSSFEVDWGSKNYTAIANWRNAAGQDQNSTLKDPGFVDSSTGNYQLTANSGAVDAGVDLATEGVILDMDSVSRPQGNAYDIGAYEYVDSLTTGEVSFDQGKTNLLVYPNPAGNKLTVIMPESNNKEANITLMNSLGQVVIPNTVIYKSSYRLLTGHLPKGIYIMEVLTGDERWVQKIVKQ